MSQIITVVRLMLVNTISGLLVQLLLGGTVPRSGEDPCPWVVLQQVNIAPGRHKVPLCTGNMASCRSFGPLADSDPSQLWRQINECLDGLCGKTVVEQLLEKGHSELLAQVRTCLSQLLQVHCESLSILLGGRLPQSSDSCAN